MEYLRKKATRSQINKLIAPLGIEIQHERGSGYFYYTWLDSGDQLNAECTYVCYFHDMTLDEWEEDARHAVEQHISNENGSKNWDQL